MCSLPALAVIGTGISVLGKISSGRSAKALAEAQAQAIEQQSEADRRAAGFEIAQQTRQFQSRQGAAIAQVGASGVGLTGSPTEVLVDNAGEHALDLEAIKYGSLLRQSQARSQAGITRWQGNQAYKASLFGAAATAFDFTKSIKFGNSPFAVQPPTYPGFV